MEDLIVDGRLIRKGRRRYTVGPDGSPEGSYGLFGECRRRAALIRKMDGGQEWFGLRIVGDGDVPGSSL
jgi:hypothetical protein